MAAVFEKFLTALGKSVFTFFLVGIISSLTAWGLHELEWWRRERWPKRHGAAARGGDDFTAEFTLLCTILVTALPAALLSGWFYSNIADSGEYYWQNALVMPGIHLMIHVWYLWKSD